MKKVTLCFPITDQAVLLGWKKRGFGAEHWNGFGGKVESSYVAGEASRELHEESGLVASPNDLVLAARIMFSFGGVPTFECNAFLVRTWNGKPEETEEMRPQWFPHDALPLSDMLPGDRLWLPSILRGERIQALLDYSPDGKTVQSFTCQVLAV